MATKVNKPNVVKLMREIRDQLSLDIMNMSFEEQKAFMSKQIKKRKEAYSKENQKDAEVDK